MAELLGLWGVASLVLSSLTLLINRAAYMDSVLSSLFMLKRGSDRQASFTVKRGEDKKLKFCNEKEAEDYLQLKSHINSKKLVKKTDISNIILHILKDRERFNE